MDGVYNDKESKKSKWAYVSMGPCICWMQACSMHVAVRRIRVLSVCPRYLEVCTWLLSCCPPFLPVFFFSFFFVCVHRVLCVTQSLPNNLCVSLPSILSHPTMKTKNKRKKKKKKKSVCLSACVVGVPSHWTQTFFGTLFFLLFFFFLFPSMVCCLVGP